MKRIIYTLIILVVITQPAFAVFTLGVNSGSVAFIGTADPGAWTQDHSPSELKATCTTDGLAAWHLSVEYDHELANGSYVIPYPNFKCWGWRQSGAGTFNIPSGSSISLSTSPFVLYDSTGSETAEIDLQFGVYVPSDTIAGTYSSNITLTMYE